MSTPPQQTGVDSQTQAGINAYGSTSAASSANPFGADSSGLSNSVVYGYQLPQSTTPSWMANSAIGHQTSQFYTAGGTPLTESAQTLANEFYGWSDKQINDFRSQLAKTNSNYLTAPTYPGTSSSPSLYDAWTGLVSAAQAADRNGKMLTPWDVLASNISATTAAGGGSKAKVTNRTVSQVNLTNRIDAQAIFTQSAQQLLGRDPTDSEVAQFQKYLNAKEQANPVVSNVRTTYDATGQVIGEDTTKSSGGVSSDAQALLAKQQAEQDPEYGAYQAATTYMNALKAAIGG